MKNLAIFVSLLVTTSAFAITLDNFNDAGVATSSTPGVGAFTQTPSTDAIGGSRTLYSVKNTFGAGVTRLETFEDPAFVGDTNFSLGYTQGAHTGLGTITWDGDNQVNLFTPAGLGSVDLTQDGGTAIRVVLKFFDFPSNNPLGLTLRLYDSSNPSGTKYSDLTVTLNQAINSNVTLEIPFTRFTTAGANTIPAPGGSTFATTTTFGPSGAVDVTKLGSAQLLLNGLTNSSAPDLTLDLVATNGRCNMVPNAQGKVVDECGVCLNSESANKGKDQCGICLFGPGNYTYKSQLDECGLCPSAPDYSHAKDACGVCGGTITDPSKCVSTDTCQTVAATEDVLAFEERLMEQARQALSRFRDESRRSIRNKCPINLTSMTKKVNTAFRTIKADGNATFTKGVQVCGDSCVTVSYAEQVKALTPQFKTIEATTTLLAKQVSQCYRKLKVPQKVGLEEMPQLFKA